MNCRLAPRSNATRVNRKSRIPNCRGMIEFVVMLLLSCLLLHHVFVFASVVSTPKRKEKNRLLDKPKSVCHSSPKDAKSLDKKQNTVIALPFRHHCCWLLTTCLKGYFDDRDITFLSNLPTSNPPLKDSTTESSIQAVKGIVPDEEIATLPCRATPKRESATRTPLALPKTQKRARGAKPSNPPPAKKKAPMPVSIMRRFEFYNKGLYLKDGLRTPLSVRNMKLAGNSISLVHTYNIQNFYRVIEMPDESASLITLLEAAAEWHFSIGSTLGEGWRDPFRLRDVLVKITESEQDQLFTSIKPPSISHTWRDFASQRAHQDLRFNIANYLCDCYLLKQAESFKSIKEIRLGLEQDRVLHDFVIPGRLAAVKFARLTWYEMQERLMPGQFPNRIRRYERRLALAKRPSPRIPPKFWNNALMIYFRTRIEQHLRTNITIFMSFEEHPRFSRHPKVIPFTLNNVFEWQYVWKALSMPILPNFSYQAVWVTDRRGNKCEKLYIMWGSPSRYASY